MAFPITYVLVAIVIGIYLYIKHKRSYWKYKGLETTDTGIFEVGGQFTKTYKYARRTGLKHAGTYLFIKPQYIPVDLDLIRNILIKDFNHFVNHGLGEVDEKHDPLSAGLFNLEDERWKRMRTKLTPTFTSGKMKMMFNTMVAATQQLLPVLNEYAKLHDPVEIKDVMARLTTDIIGSVAFGLEINSLKNPDTEFRTYGKMVFSNVPLKILVAVAVPRFLAGYAKERMNAPQKFFLKVIQDTVKYREDNNVHRNDFLHLLLQLKNRGQVFDDNKILNEGSKTNENITLNELAAQCFLFFIGGFETSSTLMNFALYELAVNQDVQERLQEEILRSLAETNGEMTYENVISMEYLDKVVNETMRLHPPVSALVRQCSKDYQVPDSDIVIKAGTGVIVPAGDIHKDPKYYENPEKFNPENFNKDKVAGRHPMAFLPFGEGPRMCIGSRFGLLQAKVGLVAVLSKYKFSLNKKTIHPLRYKSSFLVTEVEGGIWLNVEYV